MSNPGRCGKGKGVLLARFFFTLFLSLSMILSGIAMPMTGGVDKAYAKNRGSKNQQACDACKKVRDDEAPAGYTDVLGNRSVYRGGNSKSIVNVGNTRTTLDSDPTDFATPLPYGNTYVNSSKLMWADGYDYIIDVKDNRFKWVAFTDTGAALEDSARNKPTTDPMGRGDREKVTWGLSDPPDSAIAYVGELNGYLDNFTDAAKSDGNVNSIKAEDNGNEYLYKITYMNAATLPDGTHGNLVLTVKNIEIETSFTVNAQNPRTVGGVTYDKAIVAVQGANNMFTTTAIQDSNGNWITQNEAVVRTAADVKTQLDQAKEGGSDLSAPNYNGSIEDVYSRGATGAHIDLDISVTDAAGNPVKGTISYAAKDLDIPSWQNMWGNSGTGSDPHEFAEGFEIVSGSQSYALTPVYDHSRGTTLATGWVPVGPFDSTLDSPLNISGGGGTYADGAIFCSAGIMKPRDENGTWSKALFQVQNDVTKDHYVITINNDVPYGPNGSLKEPFTGTTNPGWSVRAQLAGLVPTDTINDVTGQMVLDYLGDASWGSERNDGATFDSGFAVLLDAKGSTLRWTGSTQSQGMAGTDLFDSTIFTYVEQTHGTGGGIYLESYDISDNCNPKMIEGTVTMSRSSETTVTAVPEDGHRVSRILIGDTNYGKSADTPGLNNKSTYIINGNNIEDEEGNTLGTFSENDTVKGFDNLKIGTVELDGFYYDEKGARKPTGQEQKIVIERNRDGSVDVTLPYVDNPMHVHADFSADYYFYKIWKVGKDEKVPTKLNMTAAPYAFVFTKVELDGVTYKIDGRKYTGGGATYELDENDTMVIGGKTYRLVGNDIVGPDDKVYPITVKYGKNKDASSKTFVITRADAQNAAEKNIVELGPADPANPSQGNYVWMIKYPAEGYKTKSAVEWPALPIETEPKSHAYNHVERNYWFATEDAPGWAMFDYSNSKAKAPGVVSDNYYHDADWYKAAVKDYDKADKTIKATDNMAYMSVFSKANDSEDTWGGIITNTPALIVKATKKWEDFSNKYRDRRGSIWLHIDKVVTPSGGQTTITKDILPPQEIKPGTSGSKLTKTWGDKTAYATQGSNVKVVGSLADLPSQTESGSVITYDRNKNGSYTGSDGTTYWLNELAAVDQDGNEITYQIRETDNSGKDVSLDDVDKYLLGYKTKIDEWDKFQYSTTEIGQVKVDTYSGEVKNNLKVKDITVTKKWIGPAPKDVTLTLHNKTTTSDVSQDIDKIEVEKSDFTEAGISTKAYSFKDIPKYIEGKPADYTIVETPKGDDWSAAVEGSYESGSFTVTNTNNETVEIPVTKIWDDADDQDGVRPDTITYNLTADGEVIATEKVTVDDDGKADFTFKKDDEGNDLRKYKATTGEEIKYAVTEDEIPAEEGHATGYTPVVTGNRDDGFKVSNTHVPETVKIVLEKKWVDDGADTRPDSIDVAVKADGTEIDDSPVTLTAADDWKWTSEDLPKYKAGEEIKYTAEETVPEDYAHDDADNKTTKVNNVVTIKVKNTSLIEVQGNKTWVGEDSKYGVRPESLDIQLLQTANGVTTPVPDAVVNTDEESNWSYDFGKLPAYDDEEYKITYSVDEVDVPPAYTQEVNGLNLVNTLKDPPKGEDTETYGKKGDSQTQDATEMFEKGSGEIKKYELIDPETGEPTDQPVPAYDEEGNQVGTYSIDENGKITFTPDPDFVGTPTPATVRATDDNGLWAEANYTPTVIDTTRTVKRKIEWVYNDKKGTPVREEVVQEATFIGEVDPKTGEIISWGDPQTMDSITNPKVTGWTPDITVPEWTGTPDNPPKDVKVVYTPEPPEGKPKTTVNTKNKKQSSTIKFEVTTPTTPDGSKNKIEKMLLVDPVTGKESSYVTVKGEGKYTIDKNGKITFTPEKDFVGMTSGIKVIGYDSNGYKAETTYTPEVLNSYTVTYTDPATGRTIKKTVAVKDGYPEPDPPADPTRKGYKFTGWNKVVTYDSKGNVESIVYEATWEPLGSSSGSSSGSGAKTGDSIAGLIAAVAALGVALAVIIVMIIRRRRSS